MTTRRKRVPKPAAKVPVSMRFALPPAAEAFVTGTFDNWSRNKTPLSRDADGVWSGTLLLPPGRYEYRLVVDGEWADVPGIQDTVENGFGSRNAILMVEARI